MSTEPPADRFSSVGATLVRDDRIVGNLSTPELAEWVAEACNTLAAMDEADAEWKASGQAPGCSMVDIDGEEMRVQGGADVPPDLRAALGEVVTATRGRMAEEKAAERAEIEREVREQIASQIEAIAIIARRDQDPVEAKAEAYASAARIARGARP